jgi:hypothetical protein
MPIVAPAQAWYNVFDFSGTRIVAAPDLTSQKRGKAIE